MNLDYTVSRAEFARIVGLTASRASQLAQRGVLRQGGTLAEWLQDYCESLRTQASGRAVRGPLDLSQERAELARSQRRLADVKHAELTGQLIDKAGVRAEFARQTAAVRDSLLTMPSRLGPMLVSQPDAGRIASAIDAELRAALSNFVGLHD